MIAEPGRANALIPNFTAEEAAMELTQSYLKSRLHYDPETGVFLRNGKRAGTLNTVGYRQLRLDGVQYYEHRLAWLYVYGEWPEKIDHINHQGDDNRIANLREVNNQENHQNLPRRATNKSGVTGVFWNDRYNYWESGITVNGRKRHLGCFTEFDDAVAARKAAEEHHNFHKNHGKERCR